MALRETIAELKDAFRSAPHKYAAHGRATPILDRVARDRRFLTEVFEQYVSDVASLTRKNYPVVAMPVETNADFELILHCWIPLPDGDTTLSTKAIHHHGRMLLSTANVYGPGYEHFLFSRPRARAGTKLIETQLVQRHRHEEGEVAFVDAFVAHVPIYPKSLTITLALWSHDGPTTWRDHVKRMKSLQAHRKKLRRLAEQLGLARTLDMKEYEDLDFFPVEDGFEMMHDRKEFPLGPNEDHLHSLFHVLAATGNTAVGRVVRRTVERERPPNAALIEGLVARLERGEPIEGRLSAGHYDVPFANFRVADIERAINAGSQKEEQSFGR